MITENPDKFGFYTAGNFKTYSKFESLEVAKATGTLSTWHFNDEIFGKLDWTLEPNIDLWELYKQRAIQIRNSYDYVVLGYSGGSDSDNILKAWLDAGCKIDEILSFNSYKGSDDPQSFMNAEITNVVLPKIQELKAQNVDFIFRSLDMSELNLEIINKNPQFEYEYEMNFTLSPNNAARIFLRERIKDYVDKIASGKRLCFVWGIDKPPVFFDGQKYYFQFRDVVDTCVNPYVQKKYKQGWYDELFYWSPDAPLIPIKAAHIVKRFVTTCHDSKYYQTKHNLYGYNKTINQYLTDETVKILIYPKWKPDTFCNGKGSGLIFSDRDSWIWNSNLEQLTRYKSLVYTMVQKSASINWFNKNFVRAHTSNRYYLE